jgi:hypothetical protein
MLSFFRHRCKTLNENFKYSYIILIALLRVSFDSPLYMTLWTDHSSDCHILACPGHISLTEHVSLHKAIDLSWWGIYNANGNRETTGESGDLRGKK